MSYQDQYVTERAALQSPLGRLVCIANIIVLMRACLNRMCGGILVIGVLFSGHKF